MERNRKSWNSDEIGFCLAKALFANESETSDELGFSRGDVLTVLEQNPNGLQGWWLCSLRGRQGIAPANRLRLMPGMFDRTGLGNGCYATTSSLSQLNSNHNNSNRSQILGTRRKSWNCQNRMQSPQKIGDVCLHTSSSSSELLSSNEYDIPMASKTSTSLENVIQIRQRTSSETNYDFPQQIIRQVPKATDRETRQSNEEMVLTLDSVIKAPNSALNTSHNNAFVYDIPSNKLVNELTLPFDSSSGSNSSSIGSPSSNRSSLDASLSLSSFGGSNRSSLEKHSNDNFYDILPEPRKLEEPSNEEELDNGNVNLLMVPPPPPSQDQTITNKSHESSSILQFYDIPSNKPFVEKSSDLLLSRSPPSYDIPKPNSSQIETNSEKRDQNYDKLNANHYSLNEAQTNLHELQTKCQSAINELFHQFVVGTDWRSQKNLSGRIKDLENSCHNLRDSLKSFVSFGFDSYSNALMNSTDKALTNKLLKLVKQLSVSSGIVEKTIKTIDEKGFWTLEKISITDSDMKKGSKAKLDELDQMVACARGLQEDVKHISSFISGNIKLIFPEINNKNNVKTNNVNNKPPIAPKPNKFSQQKELPKLPPKLINNCPKFGSQRPLPPLPKNNELIRETIESPDYEDCPDYVSLESKEFIEKQNEEIKDILPNDLRKSYENLLNESEVPVQNLDINTSGNISESEYGKLYETHNLNNSVNQNKINPTDQQILQFYGKEMEKHLLFLMNSIEAFNHTINRQQPPKIFINHSKFVVIAAQKLVYIAGSLQRNLKAADIQNEIIKSSNSLCDSLRTLVFNTKKAAINFPSVQSVQQMSDSLVDVSLSSNRLKLIITKSQHI